MKAKDMAVQFAQSDLTSELELHKFYLWQFAQSAKSGRHWNTGWPLSGKEVRGLPKKLREESKTIKRIERAIGIKNEMRACHV